MIEIVPIQDVRYKTSDGTHWNTEKGAILHEIECAIGEDPAYFHEDDCGEEYYDISSKESMLYFIQHNPGLVKYILGIKENKYITKIDYKESLSGFTYTAYFHNTGIDYDEAMRNAKTTSTELKTIKGYLIVNTDIEIIQCPK